MKNLKQGKLDQISANLYLDENVYAVVGSAVETLLTTIETNGEFEKYVEMLADRQERE